MLHLITAEIGRLNIKLKHVNIHNHWLCQEYQENHIDIRYVVSKKMIADGLTKVLLLDDHRRFLEQLDLIDIQDCLIDYQNQEATASDPPELMDID